MNTPPSHHIEITPGIRSGKPRIAGTRITVADVATLYLRLGQSVEEIAGKYQVEQGTGVNSSSTWIKLASNNTSLMLLSGVQASALTNNIFLPASSHQSSFLG
jgi:Protein of unknown function (DUF433)